MALLVNCVLKVKVELYENQWFDFADCRLQARVAGLSIQYRTVNVCAWLSCLGWHQSPHFLEPSMLSRVSTVSNYTAETRATAPVSGCRDRDRDKEDMDMDMETFEFMSAYMPKT